MRVLVLLAAASVATAPGGCKTFRGYAETEADAVLHPPADFKTWSPERQGGYLVVQSDFGSLTTDNLELNAIPWKLFFALVDVVPEAFYGTTRHAWQKREGDPLRRFGVLSDVTLEGDNINATGPLKNLGYARGTATRKYPDVTIELGSTNCTICHGGRTWDAEGRPTDTAYWGVPNHSADFDGMIEAVIVAAKDPRATDAALLAALLKQFPKISQAELRSYKRFVIPAFKKAVLEKAAVWKWLHPWRFGGPGHSHGAAILREKFTPHGAQTAADFPEASVKIPNVFGSATKTRLLADGSYVSKPTDNPQERMVNFLVGFLPVFGTSIPRSVAQAPRLPAVQAFLAALKPPRFPGAVDELRAQAGGALYAKRCKSCHGDERGTPTKIIPLEDIGTDPNRAASIDPLLLKDFNASAIGRFMTIEPSGGYVAPPLTGSWAQAPYFHNGSVPTLWAVLSPAERPEKFWVGGHSLDLKRVGIRLEARADGTWDYPEADVPWSEPRLYDTTAPGCSNRGHEKYVKNLTDEEKWQLIEFLKTL